MRDCPANHCEDMNVEGLNPSVREDMPACEEGFTPTRPLEDGEERRCGLCEHCCPFVLDTFLCAYRMHLNAMEELKRSLGLK